MSEPIWTIKVQRVSPITGRVGWHKVLFGAAKRPLCWTSRQQAEAYAIARHGYHAGRSKVVSLRGAP